jgi:hypothetical protein
MSDAVVGMVVFGGLAAMWCAFGLWGKKARVWREKRSARRAERWTRWLLNGAVLVDEKNCGRVWYPRDYKERLERGVVAPVELCGGPMDGLSVMWVVGRKDMTTCYVSQVDLKPGERSASMKAPPVAWVYGKRSARRAQFVRCVEQRI